MPDAGWYRDPQDSSVEEYWDGTQWSGERRPSSGDDPHAADRTAYGLNASTNIQPSYRQQQRPTQGLSGQGYQGYSDQGYAPGYAQQDHASGTPYQQYGGYTPPVATKRRKLPWIIAAVVVLVVAAGLVTFLLRPGDSPSITYRGKQIAGADAVLTSAEKSVKSLVTRVHGTSSSRTRCYYVQPTKVAKGARTTDITDSLRCGPVLFVDGTRSAEYLPVPLVAKNSDASGSKARLTPDTSSLDDTTPQAVPASVKLVRPDGAMPPSGNGGLSVPTAPPAAKNSVVAADLGSSPTPGSLSNSAMTAKDQTVRLLAAGRISHYGSGTAERSAPAGQQLIAFQLDSGEGAVAGGGTAQPVLVVDGQSHAIPSAAGDEWDVAAVPTGSTPVVQLSASGYTQTLSLPAGTPGSHNIAVYDRAHTLGIIGREFDVSSTFSKGGAHVDYRLKVNVTACDLYFWPPSHPDSHPSDPNQAFLSIGISYTRSGSSDTFGFPIDTLHLKLPDGRDITPHNIASGQKIYNVFTVPASYTDGTLTVGGSGDAGGGITQRLAKSKSFRIHIHAN